MARVSAERRQALWDGAAAGLRLSPEMAIDLLADLADAEARAERAEGALRHAAGVLGSTKFRPDGHYGDEEIGACGAHCWLCEWDAVSARVEEALTATRRGKDGDHG